MTLYPKAFVCFLFGITLLPLQQFFAQSVGSNVDAGQDKAELLGAAFSAYISGDLLQAQAYLQRARQIDRDDVTIRRLLQNLAPVTENPAVTKERLPIPATTSPSPSSDLFQPRPLSANERARQIALSNGMSPDTIDEASTLVPHVPRTVNTPLVPAHTTPDYSSAGNIPTITPTDPGPSTRAIPSTSIASPIDPTPSAIPTLPSVPLSRPSPDNSIIPPGIPPPPPVPSPTTGAGTKLSFSEIPVPTPTVPTVPELPEIITAPEPTFYPPSPQEPLEDITPLPDPAVENPPPSLFLPELPPLDPTLSPPAAPTEASESMTPPSATKLVAPAASAVSPHDRIEELIAQIGILDAQLLQAQTDGDSVKEQELSREVTNLRQELSNLEDDIINNNSKQNIDDGGSLEVDEDPLRIKVGETIELMILEDERFNGMYEVRLGGYILIPQVGRVQVAGMTVQEAEKSVHDVFDQKIIVKPSVIVERPNALRLEDTGGVIYLTGEFKRPGPFNIVRGRQPSIVSIFIQSGGETPNADLSSVRVMRLVNGRNQVVLLNLAEILEGDLGKDMILRDGDIVQIPALLKSKEIDQPTSTMVESLRQKLEDPVKPSSGRDNGVFVTGRVKSAGFLELAEGIKITAYSAILSRGGFAAFANPRKVYVLRETGGGQKVHIPVDIKHVQLGLEPDVELQAKDIIHVPEKFFSF